MRTAMSPACSMKCIAISPIALPATTTCATRGLPFAIPKGLGMFMNHLNLKFKHLKLNSTACGDNLQAFRESRHQHA